ncbi:hypothetical protein E0L36_18935 [Streptomyces sp. AJS327]|uniref:hypothetical protein n=1 Tax=Streptomyces sp. AJS327 TaxID=2545265 RepID=UPI0015DFA955|nr:hypothetical protein [Streptomyces sp. AJS327]MBA0052871.1 hypothetical protein [Streptomyces sp. AJS327]
MNAKGKRTVAACAGALMVPTLLTVPAIAAPGNGTPQPRKTTCETVSTQPAAFCRSSGSNVTQVTYVEKGDKIKILDRYQNNRWTRAIVHVKGHSKKEYSSKGKRHRTVDKNYPEGLSVRVKVCTSWTKKAKCSGWSRYFAT